MADAIPGAQPRAVIYVRVSSDEQARHGYSIAAQAEACRDWAARNGYTVAGEYSESEGVSGGTPMEQCPALMDALAALERGDVLLAWKRDRVARDLAKVLLLERLIGKRRCRLVSASGEGTEAADPNDPAAWMQRTMVDMLAQYERLQAAYRTRMTLTSKRRRNERVGRVPYGSDLVDDGRRSRVRPDGRGGLPIALTANGRERQILAWMRRRRRAGATLQRITDVLNRAGLRTKAGGRWQVSSVAYLLKRQELSHDHATTRPAAAGPQDPGRPDP